MSPYQELAQKADPISVRVTVHIDALQRSFSGRPDLISALSKKCLSSQQSATMAPRTAGSVLDKGNCRHPCRQMGVVN